MNLPSDWIVPDWGAPARVKGFITTRQGGVSTGPYASMNLGTRVNDDPIAVAENRHRLRACLPAAPRWLRQVHGCNVVDASLCAEEVEADAAFVRTPEVICTIMVADCMPVLLCDDDATVVAAAHAGWRGLAGGVIERTIEAMAVSPARLRAYLGPAIGPGAFEVGDDVHEAFTAGSSEAQAAFRPGIQGKWLCDLYTLARQRLHALGVTHIHGGSECTVSDPRRYFSHRRDRVSGRMAAFIWLDAV